MNQTGQRIDKDLEPAEVTSKHNQADRLTERISRVFASSGFRVGAAVFLLAALVRTLYLYQSRGNPTFYLPIIDSAVYDKLARALAQGRPMTAEFFWQQFFYPFFLSVVYFLSNSSILAAKLIQLFLGSLTCVLTYRLGERFFGRTAGLLAGCITAVYGPLIFFESELLATGWATFWSVLLIFLFIKIAENKSIILCLLLGLCGALSVITRPNFIPFLAAAGVWVAIVWIRQRVKAERFLAAFVTAAAGFLVVVVPIAVKNYQLTNRFSFLPATGGLNFYKGNNADFETMSVRPGIKWKKLAYLSYEQGRHDLNQQEGFYYEKAFEYIRTQPFSFIKGLLRKTVEFVSPREMPGNIDLYLFTRWSPLLNLLAWKAGGFGFPFGLLLPLALLGLLFDWRHVPIPLLLFVLLYSASVILVHIEARYRVPVVPSMCILAGAALTKIAKMFRASHWCNLAKVALFIVVVATLCSLPGPFYTEIPENVNYQAEMHHGLGGTLKRQGHIDEAIVQYRQALQISPEYAEAHYNLGTMLAEQGNLNDVTSHFHKALQIEPDYVEVLFNLGLVYQLQGQSHKAIDYYKRVLKIRPDYSDALTNMGLAFHLQGKLDQAIAYYRQALQFNPKDGDAKKNLDIALRQRAKP